MDSSKNMSGNAKCMKDKVIKKVSVSFENGDRMQLVVILLQDLLCKRRKI